MVYVRDLMTTDIIYNDVNDTLRDVIECMVRNNISSVIIHRNGVPKGIITERDIVRHLLKSHQFDLDQLAIEMMSTPLKTIDADDTAVRAAEIMVEWNIKKLVIVKDLEIKGIISQTDIIRNLRRIVTVGNL